MRVDELIGVKLDAAVADALGLEYAISAMKGAPDEPKVLLLGSGTPNHGASPKWFSPSTFWLDGGPIIEREQIATAHLGDGDGDSDAYGAGEWSAMMPNGAARKSGYRGHNFINAYRDAWDAHGPTPLVAAMRAFVEDRATPKPKLNPGAAWPFPR